MYFITMSDSNDDGDDYDPAAAKAATAKAATTTMMTATLTAAVAATAAMHGNENDCIIGAPKRDAPLREAAALIHHTKAVVSVDLDPLVGGVQGGEAYRTGARLLATAGLDGFLAMWDLFELQQVRQRRQPDRRDENTTLAAFTRAATSRGEQAGTSSRAAVANAAAEGSFLRRCPLFQPTRALQPAFNLVAGHGCLRATRWLGDGSMLVVCPDGPSAQIVRRDGKTLSACPRGTIGVADVQPLRGHTMGITACLGVMAWEPSSGREFLTASQDATVRLWSLEAEQYTQGSSFAIKHGSGRVTDKPTVLSVASSCGLGGGASPGGRMLISSGTDGTLQWWDARVKFRPGGYAMILGSGAGRGDVVDPYGACVSLPDRPHLLATHTVDGGTISMFDARRPGVGVAPVRTFVSGISHVMEQTPLCYQTVMGRPMLFSASADQRLLKFSGNAATGADGASPSQIGGPLVFGIHLASADIPDPQQGGDQLPVGVDVVHAGQVGDSACVSITASVNTICCGTVSGAVMAFYDAACSPLAKSVEAYDAAPIGSAKRRRAAAGGGGADQSDSD